VAEVVRGDEPCAGCFREPQQRLIVGIGQTRWLRSRELKAISGLADGVEKAIHFFVRQREHRSVPFQDLLLFEQQMIAKHEPPFATPEPFKNLECRAAPRKERSEYHVGIEHGVSHWFRRL
jgi:hypothetical protein